jgi:predicted RecB family nuclease
MVDGYTALLMQEGRAFHEVFVAAEVAAGAELVPPQVFENPNLLLYGIPDGIRNTLDAALRGLEAMVPVEIKWHAQVQQLDQLELAFYWLLLEPERTADGPPHGVLILHCEGAQVEVEVDIPAARIEQVRQILQDIRRARQEPVEPRICGCYVCSTVRRDEVRRLTAARQDVSLLLGVGYCRAAQLNKLGIRSYTEVAERDPLELTLAMRQVGARSLGVDEVSRWQHHARSYLTGKAVLFGQPLSLGHSYWVLDLEYLTPPWGEHIYLAGVLLVEPYDTPRLTQVWAEDGKDGERRLLLSITELLACRPELPVVTWAGHCADIPWLFKSAARQGMPVPGGPGMNLEPGRHLDLYLWAVRSLRLPTPEPRLKEMSSYFGIAYGSDVHGGTEAQMLYLNWAESRSRTKRQRLKERLLAYNRDDLDALVQVVGPFRDISAASESSIL